MGKGSACWMSTSTSFQALVEQAPYPDGLQLCLTFWNGLHSALVECIDNLAESCPDNEKIASWYKVAWNQWQLMEICPMLAPTPAIPTTQPLLLGIPMDVDAARQLHTAPLLCQRCQKPRHFSQHCPLGLEVHYLSMAEQEELLLQPLAAKDAARALSPDEPTPELTLEEISVCTSLLELEEDFELSNR
ncbi:hypothetical protein C0989_004760 [Termitomyces sp. Mn162]|nr:hypothetical protein C0989_004760 [Termitomyces sp. Mn162]